jgi:hypothetical protein
MMFSAISSGINSLSEFNSNSVGRKRTRGNAPEEEEKKCNRIKRIALNVSARI